MPVPHPFLVSDDGAQSFSETSHLDPQSFWSHHLQVRELHALLRVQDNVLPNQGILLGVACPYIWLAIGGTYGGHTDRRSHSSSSFSMVSRDYP